MQLVKAIIRKNHKERVIEELASIPDVEGIAAADTISFIKEEKSYSYRGRQVKSSDTISVELSEVSCYSEKNTETVKRIFSGYSDRIYSIELGNHYDIAPRNNLASRDVKIGFVLPEMNPNIIPIYSDITYRGYGIESLSSIPLNITSLINYDILLIDLSVRKIPADDLTALLNMPTDIPIVLINRSDNPIDKLTFLKMGFSSIHDIRDTNIILESIYAAASQYHETKNEKRGHHNKMRPEDKFVVVFSAFA